MAEDIITRIILEGLHKAVVEASKQGKSEKQIIAKIKSINIADIFQQLINKSSDDHIEYFKQTMYEKVLEIRALTNEFLSRLDQIWGKAFVTSEAMYIIASDIGEVFCYYF